MNDEQVKLLHKINRRTRFTQFLVWIALFFTAIGIAAGYKNWLRIHEKAKTGIQGVEEIRKELSEFANKKRVLALEKTINENFKDNKTHLDKALHELRNIQDSTQHIAETINSQVEALTKQQEATNKTETPAIKNWSLGEVHFLLQTAIQRFKLKQDQAGAIAAFKLADSLLLERGSLELLSVRKQISEDIASVNQYAIADTSTLSQDIDKLLAQLKPLPGKLENKSNNEDLILVDKKDKYKKTNEAAKPEALTESLVAKVKKTINNAVVIRKHEQSLQVEMDIEAKERLFQLLSLRLETLRMMLLQGDDKNYHLQTQRIISLIKNYYPEESNTKLIEQMNNLDKANLSPQLPDVSRSLILLKEIMSNTINKRNS